MIQDKSIGFVVSYNYLNLPELITFGQDEGIGYLYNTKGGIMEKTVTDHGNINITDYMGNFVYNNGSMRYMSTNVGRITPHGGCYRYEYYITDHLGNIRELFADINNYKVPELLHENNFDPFGMSMGGLNYEAANIENEIKLQGKELQKDLNLQWYNFGA